MEVVEYFKRYSFSHHNNALKEELDKASLLYFSMRYLLPLLAAGFFFFLLRLAPA